MTALNTGSAKDIDELLAQADALMNDMAADLGEQQPDSTASRSAAAAGPASVDAPAGTSQVAGQDPEKPPPGVAEPEGVQTEAAEPDTAEVAEEDPDGGSFDTSAVKESAPSPGDDLGVPGGPGEAVAVEGPQSAPPDWLAEAEIDSLIENSSELLPQIPEALAAQGGSSPDRPCSRLVIGVRGYLRLLGGAVAHAPIDLLVLLDRPFARLSTGAKTFIGYAAIGTLIVGITTWLLGSSSTAN
jgi:hypothetical protein